MEIAILTHLFEGNYGGMLQGYALYKAISALNSGTSILHYSRPVAQSSLLSQIKSFFYRIIHFRLLWQHIAMKNIVDTFVSMANIKMTSVKNAMKIDVFVVGSDQVWRCEYARALQSAEFFFLNIATPHQISNSLSYAASFGADEWDGRIEETMECARLLKLFNSVSVREHSGVKICKEVFGVDAVQMPDPTLLLQTSDYAKIIVCDKTWLPESKYVAAYVLDETAGKAELLQESAGAMNLQLQHLMPHATAKKRRDRFPISVPQWLRLIRDCEYFITDSFHGCVFAIIYNKPFVCLGNEGRGNARFDTLLGTFGLENRLVTNASADEICRVLKTPIDWERVNAIHDAERERGINFLKENLL